MCICITISESVFMEDINIQIFEICKSMCDYHNIGNKITDSLGKETKRTVSWNLFPKWKRDDYLIKIILGSIWII